MDLLPHSLEAPESREAPRRQGERFTIRQLCREFDLTARTLRFYEEKGLLSPERRGQERLYSRRDRARLQLAIKGRRIGFSLEEVGEFLDLYDIGDGQVTQVRLAIDKFDEKLRDLQARRAEIDAVIAEIAAAREAAQVHLARSEGEF